MDLLPNFHALHLGHAKVEYPHPLLAPIPKEALIKEEFSIVISCFMGIQS